MVSSGPCSFFGLAGTIQISSPRLMFLYYFSATCLEKSWKSRLLSFPFFVFLFFLSYGEGSHGCRDIFMVLEGCVGCC